MSCKNCKEHVDIDARCIYEIPCEDCMSPQAKADKEALEVGRLVLKATKPDELCFDILQWCLDNRQPPFTFHDEPGEHDPCYVVMTGGNTLALNHDARPGVDIARAKWIIALCNAALKAVAPDE